MTETILFLVGGFETGGTERHLSWVLPRLDRRRWRPVVARLGSDGPMAAPIRAADLPLYDLSTVSRPRIPKLGAVAAILRRIRAAAFLIREVDPAIIHCYLPEPCWTGWLARRLARSPAVLVMSKRSQWQRPAAFAGEKQLERRALRAADRVIGHSRVVARELGEIGVAPDRLGLLHNGIDLDAFDKPAAWAPPWPEGRIVVAVSANLIPYKGHPEILAAFARVQDRVPAAHLALLGTGDPSYVADLRRRVAEAGLADHVTFLGQVADVPAVLAAADIGLLASHHEGFSNAVLEYMAAGLPVVATDVGGNRDAVQPGRTGTLVPAGNVDALADALTALAGDMALRRRWGDAGCARVASAFSLEVCIGRYESLYAHLAAGRPGVPPDLAPGSADG